jgi:[NiFe] hydrogenase assembly HybE family chaperone
VTAATGLPARIEAVYRRIAERMAGLPACNPALVVELVGLRAWEGRWLGVLITPWTVSLLLLPGRAPVALLGSDQRQTWRFPSGEYDFMGNQDPDIGHYQTCSLFSPPAEFAGQDTARAVAQSVLDALFEAADNTREQREAARLQGRPATGQPLSRRGFLTGGGLFSTPR